MWDSTKAILGYNSSDIQTILLCMMAGLIGALVHITIVYLKAQNDNDHIEAIKTRLFAYGFIGVVIGLIVGFVFAGILKDSPSAIRTVMSVSLIAGWQAHRWFKQGVFDAGN